MSTPHANAPLAAVDDIDRDPSRHSGYDTPRTMLVHQLLMSPIFGIGTPDSVAVETMKNDYARLRGIENRTDDARQIESPGLGCG